MQNANTIKNALEPRGAAKHVAHYLSGAGRRIDERMVRYWAEGKRSPLDDMEMLLNALALVSPNSFHVVSARLAEIVREIENERGITPENAQVSLASLNKEWGEYLQAALEGKPRAEQLKELLDVVAVAQAEIARLNNDLATPLRRVG